jgi:hypothetical protein
LLDLSEIGIVAGSEMGAQTIDAARYERNLEYRHDGCPSNSQSRPRFSLRRDAVRAPFSGRVIRCRGSGNSEEPLDSVQANQHLAQDEGR